MILSALTREGDGGHRRVKVSQILAGGGTQPYRAVVEASNKPEDKGQGHRHDLQNRSWGGGRTGVHPKRLTRNWRPGGENFFGLLRQA